MNITETKNYREFFEEDLYGGFVDYLINELGHAKVLSILRNKPLISKKGVHPELRAHFNRFMTKNPSILKRFVEENQKYMGLRNIAGGELKFPVDPSDEGIMLREDLRLPRVIPVSDMKVNRPTNREKKTAEKMKGQTVLGTVHERKYLHPKRLTVHFKEGYATKLGKTTLTFNVNCRSEAMDIILDRYAKRVAYATIQNEEEFVFVRPRNGKKKRNRKLRGKVQQ